MDNSIICGHSVLGWDSMKQSIVWTYIIHFLSDPWFSNFKNENKNAYIRILRRLKEFMPKKKILLPNLAYRGNSNIIITIAATAIAITTITSTTIVIWASSDIQLPYSPFHKTKCVIAGKYYILIDEYYYPLSLIRL